MATSYTWLSLSDLSQVYGISTIHCGRALQQRGWRDQYGHPTTKAIQEGAAVKEETNKQIQGAIWNSEICQHFLQKTGYEPISRKLKIQQWVQLLEAFHNGSPSVNATASQMAEDLPLELIKDVNIQLAERGCSFRVEEKLRA